MRGGDASATNGVAESSEMPRCPRISEATAARLMRGRRKEKSPGLGFENVRVRAAGTDRIGAGSGAGVEGGRGAMGLCIGLLGGGGDGVGVGIRSPPVVGSASLLPVVGVVSLSMAVGSVSSALTVGFVASSPMFGFVWLFF